MKLEYCIPKNKKKILIKQLSRIFKKSRNENINVEKFFNLFEQTINGYFAEMELKKILSELKNK